MSPPDDLRHGLHDDAGPQVFLGEVFPIRLYVEMIVSGVVKVGNIQVDLRKRNNSVTISQSSSLYLIIQHVLSVAGRDPGVTTQTRQYPRDYLGEVLNTLDGGHCVDHLVNVSLFPEIEQ